MALRPFSPSQVSPHPEGEDQQGPEELGMTTAQDRITIYGPTAPTFQNGHGRSVGDLNSANRDGGDPTLPGADALPEFPKSRYNPTNEA
jgi:hypothetical protein